MHHSIYCWKPSRELAWQSLPSLSPNYVSCDQNAFRDHMSTKTSATPIRCGPLPQPRTCQYGCIAGKTVQKLFERDRIRSSSNWTSIAMLVVVDGSCRAQRCSRSLHREGHGVDARGREQGLEHLLHLLPILVLLRREGGDHLHRSAGRTARGGVVHSSHVMLPLSLQLLLDAHVIHLVHHLAADVQEFIGILATALGGEELAVPIAHDVAYLVRPLLHGRCLMIIVLLTDNGDEHVGQSSRDDEGQHQEETFREQVQVGDLQNAVQVPITPDEAIGGQGGTGPSAVELDVAAVDDAHAKAEEEHHVEQ